MTAKKTWSEGLSRETLYKLCWIMGITQEMEDTIRANPAWSLLPLRFYNHGVWDYCDYYDLHSVGTYENGFELCRDSRILSSKAYFAQKLWEKSTEELLKRYPEIVNITFNEQNEEGIYPIVFRYNINHLAAEHQMIMREMIDAGFHVDEYLKIDFEQEDGRKTWHYNGVVGLSRQEMDSVFYRTPHGEPLPIELRSNVSFPYEECAEYYQLFDEESLVLGNQRKAYQHYMMRNQELFDAIENKDYKHLKELVHNGFSMNEINAEGRTAFYDLIWTLLWEYEDKDDITDKDEELLDFLFEYGVNVNLTGVHPNADIPLFEAVISHAHRLFSWLIDHGADLYAQISYDEWYDVNYSYSIYDWIRTHDDDIV